MEPVCKKLRTNENVSHTSESSAGWVDNHEFEELSFHSGFDSEAETVASVHDPSEDYYEFVDWWVAGPAGPYAFAMKLNLEDELRLGDWCLESESWFPGGFILDPEPLFLKAIKDEEIWGFSRVYN